MIDFVQYLLPYCTLLYIKYIRKKTFNPMLHYYANETPTLSFKKSVAEKGDISLSV